MEAPGGSVFEALFLQSADSAGKIQTDAQWRTFVTRLVANGCIDAEEAGQLYMFWDNQKSAATAFGRTGTPVGLTFAMFERFVLRLVNLDPIMGTCLASMQAMDSATRRIIGMGQRWGSEGLDAAHARQLQQLLRDVSKLEGLVLRQVEQSVADQSTLLRADQEARLLYAPIQATRAEAAADGAGTSETGNALWFQKAWLRRIERRATKLRATPKTYRVQFRHISCNGAHILGHAPFFRCGLAPRRVEVAPAEAYFGVEVAQHSAHLHKQDEIAQIGAWYATRVDLTRKQALEELVPFELEIVKVHVSASPRNAQAVFAEIASHRELTMSPYFAAFCGVSFSDRAYTVAAFEHIQAASIHTLLAERGKLCETQPTYRFWAQEVLRAVCDLEDQCCFLITEPLTLRNVFISNQGTRVTLGRIPWGERVEADDTACSSKLAARSQLLAASFAGMLTSMLAPAEASAGRASSGAGAGAGAGASGGDGGDEATGSAASPVRTFNRIQCLRGLHVKCGESFVLELPTRAGGGYVWDPPTVVAQLESDTVDQATMESDTLDALSACGEVTYRSHDTGTAVGAAVLTCMPLRASRVGSYSLLMYQRRSWEPLPPQPSLVVQVSVHATTPSPVLRAVISACERQGAAPRGAPGESSAASSLAAPVKLASFKDHPYFHASATPNLQLVKADFESGW